MTTALSSTTPVEPSAAVNRADVAGSQELVTPLPGAEVVARLEQASKRGKLPGFARGTGNGTLFTITDFGKPFESVMEAHTQDSAGEKGAGTRLHFQSRLKPMFPWLFGLSLVITVWPGVWLTDSLLRTYFSWYSFPPWVTWAWYLPLTAPFCPWIFWKAVKQSRASAASEMADLIPKIAAQIDAARASSGEMPSGTSAASRA